MTLNIDDLGTVWEALFDTRSKAYNIGLKLKVPVGTLDSIKLEFSNPANQLRETLKAWLKMAEQQKWQTIVEMLRSRIISEPKLASDIEAEYCQGTPAQGSGQAMPRDVQIQALQQHFEQKLQEQQRAIEAMQIQQALKEQLPSMKRSTDQPQPNPPQQETTLRKLIWRDGPKAPETMPRGSVATDGTMVYCNGRDSTSVHQYHSDTQQWRTLPDLPHLLSTLVMANSKLTSVGGLNPSGATNSLFSLTGEDRDRKWSQHFPPMTTKRCLTAAICHGCSLIIAGGNDGHNRLATVEVLNMDTQLWSFAGSLPHPFSDATTSICGERLYLLGGCGQSGLLTHLVLTCTISKLLLSCQKLSQFTIWQHVTDAPYKASSCATLCGQLVVVGAYDEANKDTTTVRAYDESTDSWLAMEAMKTPRYRALVASLHDNTMLVIGGLGLDAVEIAKLF